LRRKVRGRVRLANNDRWYLIFFAKDFGRMDIELAKPCSGRAIVGEIGFAEWQVTEQSEEAIRSHRLV